MLSLPVSFPSTAPPSDTNLDTLLEAYFIRLKFDKAFAHSLLPLLLLPGHPSFRTLLMLSDGALLFLLPHGAKV
jgi:hypothetical protein